MPNYCTNNLYISGDESEVVKFIKATYQGTDFDSPEPDGFSILRKLVPTPEELANTRAGYWTADTEEMAEYQKKSDELFAKYGYKDWYDWSLDNWGTKWGDMETTLCIRSDGYVSFSFESAWCAPEIGIDKVSQLFPELEFVLTYMEQGMGFVGANAYKNGRVASAYTEKITGDYEDTDVDDIMEQIDEAYFKALEDCEAQVMLEAGFNHAKV
jgi:hypothetical protein